MSSLSHSGLLFKCVTLSWRKGSHLNLQLPASVLLIWWHIKIKWCLLGKVKRLCSVWSTTGLVPFSVLKISWNVYIAWIWIIVCIILKEGLIFHFQRLALVVRRLGVVVWWCCWTHMPELKPTCESLDAWTLEKTCWTVFIVPVGLCRQVPAVVDVIILLLDLQAVKVCGWDGAHGVRAGGQHIQPTDTEQRIQSAYSLT